MVGNCIVPSRRNRVDRLDCLFSQTMPLRWAERRLQVIEADLAARSEMKFFEKFPRRLRQGPWCLGAKLFLVVVVAALPSLHRFAIATSSPTAEFTSSNSTDHSMFASRLSNWSLCLRWWGALHGTIVLLHMRYSHKSWWAMISFTMQSWTWMTFRYVAAAVEASFSPPARLETPSLSLWHWIPSNDFSHQLAVRALEGSSWVRETLRFPALLQNTITVAVWWLALVPVVVASSKPKHRKAFLKWNFSFFLVNVHLLNLPLAAADQLLIHPVRLFNWHDVWVAAVMAVTYLIFYLLVLDRVGLHFYIILSPRTWWCVVVYSLLLLAGVGLKFAWDWVTAISVTQGWQL